MEDILYVNALEFARDVKEMPRLNHFLVKPHYCFAYTFLYLISPL